MKSDELQQRRTSEEQKSARNDEGHHGCDSDALQINESNHPWVEKVQIPEQLFIHMKVRW